MSLLLLVLLACSGDAPEDETATCSADCATVTTSPPDGATVNPSVTVTVSIEPEDRAFDAELYGPDGEGLGGVVGSGTLDLVLSTNQLPEGELELVVRSSCDPAPAEPCNEDTYTFMVSADAPTTPTTNPTDGHDVFLVAGPPAVDVLFVIDDSCSMGDKQATLSQELPRFMEFFVGSGLDYHIGAVTTSPGSPALLRSDGTSWIDPDTANAVQVFTRLTLVGTGGVPEAQAFTTSQAAIEAADGGVNDGFTRADADLVVVVVSDSDDRGPITAPEYVAWIEGLGRPQVHFIPVAPTGGYDVATKYFAAADALGSPSYDLDALGPEVLEGVGLQAAGLQRGWCTTQLAVPGSLEVEVHLAPPDGPVLAFVEGEDWEQYEGHGVTCMAFLEYVPEPGSEVHLTYDPA